jgi:hypothetical protein
MRSETNSHLSDDVVSFVLEVVDKNGVACIFHEDFQILLELQTKETGRAKIIHALASFNNQELERRLIPSMIELGFDCLSPFGSQTNRTNAPHASEWSANFGHPYGFDASSASLARLLMRALDELEIGIEGISAHSLSGNPNAQIEEDYLFADHDCSLGRGVNNDE